MQLVLFFMLLNLSVRFSSCALCDSQRSIHVLRFRRLEWARRGNQRALPDSIPRCLELVWLQICASCFPFFHPTQILFSHRDLSPAAELRAFFSNRGTGLEDFDCLWFWGRCVVRPFWIRVLLVSVALSPSFSLLGPGFLCACVFLVSCRRRAARAASVPWQARSHRFGASVFSSDSLLQLASSGVALIWSPWSRYRPASFSTWDFRCARQVFCLSFLASRCVTRSVFTPAPARQLSRSGPAVRDLRVLS
jgi:hypothetical protein